LLHHFSWLGHICKSMDGVPEHVLVTILHCPDILGFCALSCTVSHQECCWWQSIYRGFGLEEANVPCQNNWAFFKINS
jgi:hypothetical protein